MRISTVLACAWFVLVGGVLLAEIILTTPGGPLFPFVAGAIALTLLSLNALLSS
jgi:hypothetical protein